MTLKQRKTPIQPRAQASVAAIMEAAAQILEREGTAGFNTNKVALRAGVSIGTLYQYFPNKGALMVALINQSLSGLSARITDIAKQSEGLTFDETLRLFVRAAVAHQMARPELERLLDVEERYLAMGEDHDNIERRIVGQIIGTLAHHNAAPTMTNLESTARDVAAIASALIDAAAERGERDAVVIEDRIVRAVRGYLA